MIQTFDERTSTRHIREQLACCALSPPAESRNKHTDYATIIILHRFHRSHVRSPRTEHFASKAGERSESGCQRGRVLCECEHPETIAIALRMLIQSERLASSKPLAALCMRRRVNLYHPASRIPTRATMILTTPPLVTCTELCKDQQSSALSLTSPKRTLGSLSDRISTAAKSNTAQSRTSRTTY